MKTVALLAILSSMMVPLVSQALLWDFNNDAQEADWTVINGICEIDDGTYKVSAPAQETLAITGNSDWTDYTISCKARLTQPGDFNNIAIAFRASEDGSNEYMLMLEGGRQQAEWWKKIGGGYTEIRTDPLAIDTKDWFSFKVVVEGKIFECYYDGEFVSEIEDEDLDAGKVGVRVFGCTSHIDDFDVNGPGIPATGVEAQGKLTTVWAGEKVRRGEVNKVRFLEYKYKTR